MSLPADGVARAAGVSTWTAKLTQSDDAIPGAIDLADDASGDGRLVLDFVGRDDHGAAKFVGRWAVSTARALALADDAAFSEYAAMVSGSSFAFARDDGSPGDATDDATAVTLFTSFASSLAAWQPAPSDLAAQSVSFNLHPLAAAGGGARIGCDKKTTHAALHEVGTMLDAMLTGAAQDCASIATGRTAKSNLGVARPGVFGVNAGGRPTGVQIASLAAAGVKHVRTGYYPPYFCKGLPAVGDASFPTTVAAAQSTFACMLKRADQALADYASSGIELTTTLANLDGFEGYRDGTGGRTWSTYASAWETYACAAIADRSAHDPSASHVYELWNEPDKYGAAPLPPALLVPMVLDVVRRAQTPGSDCYDANAKFSIGAATADYYVQALAQPGGPELLHRLAFYNLHPYGNWPGAHQSAIDSDQFRPEDQGGQSLDATLSSLASKVMTITGYKPITLTEWGWNAGMPPCEGPGNCHPGNGVPLCDTPEGKKSKIGCQLSEAQCQHEAAEIAHFYGFLASPPADVAGVAADVTEADMYGFERSECHGLDVSAMKAASRLETTDASAVQCANDRLRPLVLSLRKAQGVASWLCCNDAIDFSNTYLAVRKPAGAACTCAEHDASKPKKHGSSCVACDGTNASTIAGCTVVPPPPVNSCVDKADGWYCSATQDFTAYECKSHSTTLGYQCAQSQTCSASGSTEAIIDATTDMPACDASP